MKKIYFIALCVATLLSSCVTTRFTLGMDEQEFLRKNRVELVETTVFGSIYRKVYYQFGAPPTVRFFYFQDGRLSKVDAGQRDADVLIDIR